MTTALLPEGHVFIGVRTAGKAALLRELARLAAAGIGWKQNDVAAALMAREALGTTGFGGGLAVPHARLPGLAEPAGFLARLARPIDYDAIDGAPVDLVFLLLTPLGEDAAHLAQLAAVSRRLRDPAVAAALRRGRTEGEVLAAFNGG